MINVTISQRHEQIRQTPLSQHPLMFVSSQWIRMHVAMQLSSEHLASPSSNHWVGRWLNQSAVIPSIVCDLAALISQVARRRDAHNAFQLNIAFLRSGNKIAEDAIIPATVPFAFHKIRRLPRTRSRLIAESLIESPPPVSAEEDKRFHRVTSGIQVPCRTLRKVTGGAWRFSV